MMDKNAVEASKANKRQNSASVPSSRERKESKNPNPQPSDGAQSPTVEVKRKDDPVEGTKDVSPVVSSAIVIDKFRVDPSKTLGEGSYATVCLSTHTESEVNYACKIINAKKNMGNFIDRFLPRELKLMRKFNSERVTCVYGIYKAQHLFYIFMDHCENGDLLRYLQRRGRALDEEETRDKTLQILLGVRYLHEEQQVAHRDLKCENVLMDSTGRLKLGDFGFARSCIPLIETSEAEQTESRILREFMTSDVANLPCSRIPARARRTSERAAISTEIARIDKLPGSSGSSSNLASARSPSIVKPISTGAQQPVASSTFCGSVAYAAPEVLSRKSYEPKKYDMWSTGVIVFIMACFFMPFDDSDQTKMVRRQMSKKWRYPPDTKISDSLKEFLEGMMEPNPKERYSVGEGLRHKWLRRLYREVLVEEQRTDQTR